jgi:hypothetical protein
MSGASWRSCDATRVSMGLYVSVCGPGDGFGQPDRHSPAGGGVVVHSRVEEDAQSVEVVYHSQSAGLRVRLPETQRRRQSNRTLVRPLPDPWLSTLRTRLRRGYAPCHRPGHVSTYTALTSATRSIWNFRRMFSRGSPCVYGTSPPPLVEMVRSRRDSLALPTLNSTSTCQFGTLRGIRDHSHPV